MPYTGKHVIWDDNFLAMLAHDMKTPVNAQIRAVNLLYSGVYGEFSQEAKNLILNIIASNKYLQCLLNNVLGEYRINKERFSLNKTENDLRKTLEEALCNIGILSEVKGQKITVNYLTDKFIRIYDEIEIQRVVINLLSNAFEYAKENSEINITVEEEFKKIRVKFKSFSSSFSKEKNERNYERFGAGFGLGFLICDKIITAHGGDILREITEKGDYLVSFSLP
ncbi:MAG: HAMP domain-containing sensor histidine kinase [bacterium]|nr:HAMP domain-containing sensor histidine kinase [bacterium]